MATLTIGVDQLGAELGRQRESRGLSLRAVEAATGISAATLSRVERGSTPESAIIQRLAEWLEVSVVHADTGGPVLATTAIRTDEDLKRTIAVHLRANKKLAPEVASAIADGFEYFMRAEIARVREHQRGQQRSTPRTGRGTPNAGGSEGL